MSKSESSSVQRVRQAIADRLREIMRDAGLNNRELARRAGWDETKCSRLIHARTRPSDADIRTWCTICGVPEEIPNLIAASRNAENAYVEWRRVNRSVKHLQELRLALYEETTLFRFYCSNVIPWPLQTPGYMRALIGGATEFRRTGATDIEEGVQARVARQETYLGAGSHRRCAMIVEEPVLYGRVGDDVTMREQLRHLLTGMHRANLSFGVVPMGIRRPLAAKETFSIYDESRVFIELLSAAVTITSPGEIDLYVRYFAELSAVAAHGDKARALITRAIAALP
ncbi:helix-turn-helix domain-containing protein [Bailinhaonella thermotolerans]|uniref:helix-turn-helix domain-containing protein n=1 Tax=Bailinhaonella thermotolerans TaxID=1070861 RepID=UPI00192A36B9|nr:helix-turn-helix transcriptional regulator [Bailinhaonella thermotolerans]